MEYKVKDVVNDCKKYNEVLMLDEYQNEDNPLINGNLFRDLRHHICRFFIDKYSSSTNVYLATKLINHTILIAIENKNNSINENKNENKNKIYFIMCIIGVINIFLIISLFFFIFTLVKKV